MKRDVPAIVRSVFLGVAAGDALGVPVEFKSREELQRAPVRGMIGQGSHHQPPGTFSDDSSLTFCTAESLIDGYDPERIGQSFLRWYREGYWTARGDVFDIGHTTQVAMQRLEDGVQADKAGPDREASNGNGALMRMAPIVFTLKGLTIPERFRRVRQLSSITHGHLRSAMACFYYVEYARLLLEGIDKCEAYRMLQDEMRETLPVLVRDPAEIAQLGRLMTGALSDQPEGRIRASGYVLHTLEASIWCLLTTDSFSSALLKAVNLGEDTDTTGAVTGALAGLIYPAEDLPASWLECLARRDDIEDLARRFAASLPA